MARRPKVGTGTSVHPKGYKSNPDSIPLDKYDYILHDFNRHPSKQKKDIETEKIIQRNESDNTFIKQIQNMNFISVWAYADQKDKCVCEGKNFIIIR